jgi:hypothetical protein
MPPLFSRGVDPEGRQSISTTGGVECLIDPFLAKFALLASPLFPTFFFLGVFLFGIIGAIWTPKKD